VVCASCSPHRITIPSAFVVRPPHPIQVIDLASTPEPPSNNSSRRPSSWLSASDQGGEEDRESFGNGDSYRDIDDDDDYDGDIEALMVRICDECLGRRLPEPAGGWGLVSSRTGGGGVGGGGGGTGNGLTAVQVRSISNPIPAPPSYRAFIGESSSDSVAVPVHREGSRRRRQSVSSCNAIHGF
jgi:hypothetical protein